MEHQDVHLDSRAAPSRNASTGPNYSSGSVLNLCSPQSQQQQLQQTQRPRSQPPATVKRSSSATSFAEVAKQHKLQQLQQRQRHQQPEVANNGKVATAAQSNAGWHSQGSSSGVQHHQQQQSDVHQLVQELSRLHPWCEPELLHEVLLSVGSDAAAAAAALVDLAAAASEEALANSSRPGPSGSARRGSVGRTADNSSLSYSNQLSSNDQQQEQPHVQQQVPAPVPKPVQGDVYHAVRQEALRLTRQWQKLLRRWA